MWACYRAVKTEGKRGGLVLSQEARARERVQVEFLRVSGGEEMGKVRGFWKDNSFVWERVPGWRCGDGRTLCMHRQDER